MKIVNLKKSIISKTILLAFSFVISSTLATEKVVNVYNWSDYIDTTILKEFTAKTGIKVVYDVFDSNEVVETKLLSGSTGYDIVVPSHNFLGRQIKAGVFQKLDKEKLPNIKHMSKDIAEKITAFDPDNNYSINYMWGTAGIGYNKELVAKQLADTPINSWELIFNPVFANKLSKCGIYWMDTPEVMLPAALAYLGLNPLSTDKDELQKATDLMIKVRGTVRKFDSSEYISALANGDICIAVGYSGDVLQAKDRALEANNNVDIEYIIPKEGGQLWFDQMAITSDAPHKEEAYIFMNYIMQPEVIAKATNFVSYANGNKDSNEFIDKKIITNKGIYPDKETRDKLWVQSPLSSKEQRKINRLWTKVQTGI